MIATRPPQHLTPKNLWGHVTVATPSFTLFSHSGVGGLQDTCLSHCYSMGHIITSFVWSLCMCLFVCPCSQGRNLGYNWVKIGDTVNGFWPPKKLFFRFRFRTSVPNFVEISSKLRPWEHGQTHTHTHTDHTSDLIICPMLCYSNGTDQNIGQL